ALLHRTCRAIAAQVRFDPMPAAPALAPVAASLPAPLPDDAASMAPYRRFLDRLPVDDAKQVLYLHRHPPAQWPGLLSAPSMGYPMIMALAGNDAWDGAGFQGLLDAAIAALRSDGVLIMQFDNPENLLVADRLLRQATQCQIL